MLARPRWATVACQRRGMAPISAGNAMSESRDSDMVSAISAGGKGAHQTTDLHPCKANAAFSVLDGLLNQPQCTCKDELPHHWP